MLNIDFQTPDVSSLIVLDAVHCFNYTCLLNDGPFSGDYKQLGSKVQSKSKDDFSFNINGRPRHKTCNQELYSGISHRFPKMKSKQEILQ